MDAKRHYAVRRHGGFVSTGVAQAPNRHKPGLDTANSRA